MKRFKSLLSKGRSIDAPVEQDPSHSISHPVGCETLFEGVAPIEADVVFVHGLCGHPRETWTKDDVCWPEDLLSEEESLSHIRVLTFGYDANVVNLNGSASLNSLFDHSIDLLNELSRERKRDASNRPIIFVAHSLGGLIVKDALDYADKIRDTHPHLANIFSSSRGIIFLGTPHRGSDSISLSKVVASAAQVASSNTKTDLIRILERDSQTLDRIRDCFSRILHKHRLTIWSFVEELPIRGVEKVVSGDSAVIGDVREHRGTIHADHIGMTEFSSRSDPNYKKVLYALEMLIEALREHTPDPADQGTSETRKSTTFYNVPPLHLPHFVTRKAFTILENLFECPTAFQLIVVVIGMGGVGKTQLVLEFCRRVKGSGKFRGIFWLDSSSRGTLYRSMDAIARQLFPERVLDDPASAITLVKDILSNCSEPWLMVFDNLDNPDDLRGFLEFIPDSRFGSILVTSRYTGSKELGQSIELDCMEKDEGLQLLLRSQQVDSEDLAAAEQILTRLGYLPLAIDQARAYISKRQLRFRNFMDEYENRKGKVMREVPQFWQYRRTLPNTEQEMALSLVTTWEMSLSLLDAGDETSSKLGDVLTVFAHFHPVSISEYLFICDQDGTTSPMTIFKDNGVWNHVEFEDAVVKMRELSLVQFSRRSEAEIVVSLHAMVSEWLRIRLDKDSQSTFLTTSVSHLQTYLDQTDHKDFETRRESLSHLNTISQVMDISPNPNRFFEACNSFAVFYRDSYQFDDAERMYNRTLVGYETTLGPDHMSTLDIVNSLGILYRAQGRYDDAERMHNRVLAGREKAAGLDHKSTLVTFRNLGTLYEMQCRFDDAEKMYNRALAGFERALGAHHMDTLHTVNNLGVLYGLQCRLDDAELMFSRALAGFETILGLEHVLTLTAVSNLGSLYFYRGRLEDAERMHNRALADKEKSLGLDHILTLDTVDNLGFLYTNQGRLDDAERMYDRALAGKEKVLGVDHISTLGTIGNLALLYVDQGRLVDAERMHNRILAGFEKALGPDHMDTLEAVNNFGVLYVAQGRLDDAEKMYNRALAGREKALGLDHMHTLDTVNNLGVLYVAQGRLDDAERMYSRALSGRMKVFGPGHKFTLDTVKNLRVLYERQGRIEDAERCTGLHGLA